MDNIFGYTNITASSSSIAVLIASLHYLGLLVCWYGYVSRSRLWIWSLSAPLFSQEHKTNHPLLTNWSQRPGPPPLNAAKPSKLSLHLSSFLLPDRHSIPPNLDYPLLRPLHARSPSQLPALDSNPDHHPNDQAPTHHCSKEQPPSQARPHHRLLGNHEPGMERDRPPPTGQIPPPDPVDAPRHFYAAP